MKGPSECPFCSHRETAHDIAAKKAIQLGKLAERRAEEVLRELAKGELIFCHHMQVTARPDAYGILALRMLQFRNETMSFSERKADALQEERYQPAYMLAEKDIVDWLESLPTPESTVIAARIKAGEHRSDQRGATSYTPPRKGRVFPEGLCAHTKLLNRGAPPNTNNQRVCSDCGKKFAPPVEVGGICEADDGQRVRDQ